MANVQYLPYAQQVAAIERQRKLADLLQQQGMQPSTTQMVSGIAIPTSPWETASKLAQNIASIYAQGRADKEEAALKERGQQEAKDVLKQYFEDLNPKTTTTQKLIEPTEAGTPEEYQDIMNRQPQYGAAETPEDYQNLMNTRPTRAETTVTPGMNRQQALARILELQASGTPQVADLASKLIAVLPKEAEQQEWSTTPFESGGKLYVASKSGQIKETGLEAKPKESNVQRFTKETIDQNGNTYSQSFVFDPVSGTEKAIGDRTLKGIPTPKSPNEAIEAGAKLRNEYNNHPDVRNYGIVSSAYENILNNAATGAGDMRLIFSYMKMLDPTTGVKEGEYATAADTGSLPQTIVNMYNKALKGDFLNDEQRQNFVKEAKSQYDTAAGRERVVRQGIERIGQETGVNPRLYTAPEPKRRASELPSGFVLQPTGTQQQSLMFQSPNGRL